MITVVGISLRRRPLRRARRPASWRSGYVVTADFPESGGIFENAEVTYRGVAVGRVDRLRLADDGVHVDLRLERRVTVPRDTDAVVENRSAVGEQYVDLQPRHQGGPFLADGDRIASDRTRTPLHVETLLLNLDRLVNSVDRRDLVGGDRRAGPGLLRHRSGPAAAARLR